VKDPHEFKPPHHLGASRSFARGVRLLSNARPVRLKLFPARSLALGVETQAARRKKPRAAVSLEQGVAFDPHVAQAAVE
jgi:hypothetical protein